MIIVVEEMSGFGVCGVVVGVEFVVPTTRAKTVRTNWR